MAVEIEVEYLGEYRTCCRHTGNNQEILTDAPKDNKGKGEMFSPTDLFATSLASCILTTMGIYAKSIGIDIEGTKIIVTKEMATTAPRRIKKLKIALTSPHSFEQDITKRLEQAGERCPVHLSLHPEVILEFDYKWGPFEIN